MATLQTATANAASNETSIESRMNSKKDGGATTISDQVVAKIAGIAAREVEGVQELTPQSFGGTISGLANKVQARSNLTTRVSGCRSVSRKQSSISR